MVDGSWMFLASSPPEDPSHWFHQLRQSTAPSYRDISFENICAKCLELPQEEWTKCTHIKKKSSTLKDKSRFDELNTQIKIGDTSRLVRENAGVTVQTNTCIFHEKDVKKMFDRSRQTYGFDGIDMYLMAIDPSYGGSNDTAISVIARVQGFYTLIWADYRETVKDLMPTIMKNIAEFHRIIRKTIRIPVIIAIEAISRIDGNQLAKFIGGESANEYQNIHVITDESNAKGFGLEGVRLSRDRKIQMVSKLETLFEEGNLRIHEKFATSHPKGAEHVLNELSNQLIRFRGLGDGFSMKLNGTKRKDMSGKRGLRNDDLVLVLLMAVFWWRRFRIHERYAFQRNLIELFHTS